MTDHEQTCEICNFFKVVTKPSTKYERDYGACRFNPPTESGFPPTQPNAWCSKWTRFKEKKAPSVSLII